MSSFEMLGVFTPAQKSIVRGWWKKVTTAHPKARHFREMKVPIAEKGVFGILLVDSIQYASSSISYIDDGTETQCFGVIPTIIAKCGSFLKEEAMTTEGIFRVSGSARRTRILQSIFDTPELYGSQLDWRGYTVHDAANVLKRFLNFLPEPVITLEYYRVFKDTTLAHYSSLDKKIEAIQDVIIKLPTAHQYLLLYMLDLLSMFATAAEYTRMDVSCLSAVFAPGILSHPDDELNPAGYFESQRVLSFLIEHQDRFSMPTSTHSNVAINGSPSTGPIISLKSFTGGSSRVVNKHGSEDKRPPLSNKNRLYSMAAGSYSNTDIESIPTTTTTTTTTTIATTHLNTDTTINNNCSLKRSKTAPSKRHKYYGSHEPQQVIYVNRTHSQHKK